jgi:DNA-binding beta-propeller fold protein YncE
MAINKAAGRLYVLTTADAAIKVIEIGVSRVVDTISIPLTVEPNFMTVTPDGSSAFVLEEYGNNLIRIDLAANSLGSRVSLGERPQYALYMEDRQRLAVASTRSNTVLLLEPQNLTTLESIAVGSTPLGLARRQGLLYIAENGSDSVAVYDLDNRRIRSHVTVGRQPKRILATDDRLYITSFAENSLSVLLPGQFSVSRQIPLTGPPLEMAATDNRRWLYVGIADSQAVDVVDLTSNRVAGTIKLGADPAGIAVMQ